MMNNVRLCSFIYNEFLCFVQQQGRIIVVLTMLSHFVPILFYIFKMLRWCYNYTTTIRPIILCNFPTLVQLVDLLGASTNMVSIGTLYGTLYKIEYLYIQDYF